MHLVDLIRDRGDGVCFDQSTAERLPIRPEFRRSDGETHQLMMALTGVAFSTPVNRMSSPWCLTLNRS